MTSPKQLAREATGRQDFRHSLQVLDGISSWLLWSNAVMILLLPPVLVLVSFQSRLSKIGLFQVIGPGLIVRASLGAIWIVCALTLYRQRDQLNRLRQGLIEQTDAATKNRVRGEQFYGLSILDPLTGLYNRRFGEARLAEEIARALESHDPLLLLAFDFNRFKQINDKLGHAAGDLALKEFSHRLQRAIRACDIPIRVGGDEFLVILPECPPENVKLIFDRMGQVAFTLDGKQIPFSFSYGMAQYQVNDTPETMIKRADERLYDEKAKRKALERAEQPSASKSEDSPKESDGTSDDQSVSESVSSGSSGRTRRSARITMQIPVILIGNDLLGKVFSEHTNTINVSRHGLGVVSKQKIAPDQEMIVRRKDTNQEAPVRVVRAIRSGSRTQTYGLEFTGPDNNIWNVEFPPLTESEKVSTFSLFECSRCKVRKTLDNGDGELKGSARNKSVVRSCERCGGETTWNRLSGTEAGTSVAENPKALAPEVTVH